MPACAFKKGSRLGIKKPPRTPAVRSLCTQEIVMRSHEALARSGMNCSEVSVIWSLIGQEVGLQLSKRRGVKLTGVGALLLTSKGIRLMVKAEPAPGSLPAHLLSLAAVAEKSKSSRKCIDAVLTAVLNELIKCRDYKWSARLTLMPAGWLLVSGNKIIFEADSSFSETCQKAWNHYLARTQNMTARGDFRPRSQPSHDIKSEPPAYSTVVGRRKKIDPRYTPETIVTTARNDLFQRYGEDALCVFARALKSNSLTHLDITRPQLAAALDDAGAGRSSTTADAVFFLLSNHKEQVDLRSIEKLFADARALVPERRAKLDELWRQLCLDHARVITQTIKGVPRNGMSIDTEYIPLQLLASRLSVSWHSRLILGLESNQAVRTRILAHFDTNEKGLVSKTAFRAAMARISATVPDDIKFRQILKYAWDPQRSELAEQRELVLPHRLLEQKLHGKQRHDNDRRLIFASASDEEDDTRSYYTNNDDQLIDTNDFEQEECPEVEKEDAWWTQIPENNEAMKRINAIYALREFAYSPPCDYSEFVARLAVTGSHRISRDELAQRITACRQSPSLTLPRALTLVNDLDGEGRMICLETLHAHLTRLFGRSIQRRTGLHLLRPHLPQIAHLGLTAPTLRLDIPNGVADLLAERGCVLGFKQKTDLAHALINDTEQNNAQLPHRPKASLTCREIVLRVAGGQTQPLRRAAVEATFARLARHCGVDTYSGHLSTAQLHCQLSASSQRHAPDGIPGTVLQFASLLPTPITRDNFIDYYDAVSATVDGDVIFINHLRDAWQGGRNDPRLDAILAEIVID